MTVDPDPALRKRLHALAALLPVFEAPGFEFGAWNEPSSNEGVMTMPFFMMSDGARAFFDVCYEEGWVRQDFDWPRWSQTKEYRTLAKDPDALGRATPEQLANLVTVMIRQDRFVEGSLYSDFRSGLIVNVLRRAAALEAENPSKPRKTRKAHTNTGGNP